MSSNVLKIKEQNTMLKKEYHDLSHELISERRKNKQLTEQALTKIHEVSAEVRVCFKSLGQIHTDVDNLRNEVVDLQLQLLAEKECRSELLDIKSLELTNEFRKELSKEKERERHITLTVVKLLSLKDKGHLDNRLFDASAEEFDEYLSHQFQVTLIEAQQIRLLYKEWA